MKVTIDGQGFSVSHALDEHARQQVREALSVFTHCVVGVELCLRDVSDPGGPTEYNVVASVSMRNMPPAVVEGNGCDLFLTVRYAARRAQRAVERAVRRSDNASVTSARPRMVFEPVANPAVQAEG